ncbi:MAG: cytochrome b/b6 domain-containing protein [Burkholderiales bacterium]
MQTSPSFPVAQTDEASAPARGGRLVVDAPTRMFHWLFALCFVGAYATADGEHWRALHITLGYTLAGLLALRVIYGLVGPRHARIGLLWRRLAAAPDWLRSIGRARTLSGVNWRQGQNLLMALAVATLMVWVVPLTLSGYAIYNDWGDFIGGDWIEDVHEFFGEAYLAIVLGHLALIAGLSLLRRRNQAQAMLTGRVEGAGPDLVKRNRIWLAAAVLLAAIAFAAWVWPESDGASSSIQPASSLAAKHKHLHDDD